jgi:hypothetical protein
MVQQHTPTLVPSTQIWPTTAPTKAPLHNNPVTSLLSFKMGEYDPDMIQVLRTLGVWDEGRKGELETVNDAVETSNRQSDYYC